MFPGADPNNVARMAQLLKNPQYLSMLANGAKMGHNGVSPFQPTLIHHPTAGTTLSSSHMAPNAATLATLMVQQQQQHQQQQQQQANINSANGTRIMPTTIPGSGNNGAVTTASKWHDDLSRNTRQELFNTIVEIKTGKSFNGDKTSIDAGLSKAILNQISKIWKQTNSKEQFAQELSQWLATETGGYSQPDIEKKLLELMNKSSNQQPKPPSSSVGVENLFGMMSTAASSIGTNSSFPNITNPINAKNPTGPNGTSTTTSTSTTTTSNNTTSSTTTTSTAVNNNNNNTNGATTTPGSNTNQPKNNTNGATTAPGSNTNQPKKITQQDIDRYLQALDFLKQHEDMIRQYMRTVAAQHAELTKRFKAQSTLPPSEEQSKLHQNIQKNQMILSESRALEKILSYSKEERMKHIETLQQKSYAFAFHIKDVIEKKLKPNKDAQPPRPPPTAPLPPPTTSNATTASTGNVSSTTVSSAVPSSSNTSTSTSVTIPPTNSVASSTTVQPPPTQTQQNTSVTSSNPPTTTVSQNHKKDIIDDGFLNLKKIGESSLTTFNQDSFYSALGEMNIKNLTYSTKRKLIPESTEHEKVLKRIKTPIDILQNNLTNLIEFDNVIEFKNTINIKSIEDARYQLDFIINPTEKGILNLPVLTLCVIVNHNEIIPYSISFSHNYANEKNSIFVNIRKYFNNLLIENTTSYINTSEMLSTQNNTFHIQRYNLSLNCILNSWISSINTVVKKELQ